MKIDVINLSKSFGSEKVINGFNFTFKEKTFYSIVGASGSGKSTLLSILSLLDDNYEGEIYFDKKKVKKLNPYEKSLLRLHNLGFIFQNFNLLNEDTVFNNLMLILDGSFKMTEEAKRKRIEEVLDELDLNELRNSYCKNLSGGEKQRVAIARAIIGSPSIILCDEPTGSLDELNTENIFNILKKLSKYLTVIYVTHDVENAKKYSDVILNIDNKNLNPYINNAKKACNNPLNIQKMIKKEKDGKISLRFLLLHT